MSQILVDGKSLIYDFNTDSYGSCLIAESIKKPQDSPRYSVFSGTWTSNTPPNRRSISDYLHDGEGLLSFLCHMEIDIDLMNNIFLFLTIVNLKDGTIFKSGI